MSSTSEEAWRGTTADERAGQRRRQLLDAAHGLLGTEGAAGVTVRAVTRSAGLSPRFFYESFADRDALVIAAWEEQYDEVAALVAVAVGEADESFRQRIRAALMTVARWFEERPERAVVMLQESLADPMLRRHARRRLPDLVLTTMAASVDPSEMATLSPTDVQISITALSGAIVNLFLEWTAGRIDVTAEHLVESIVLVADNALAQVLG